MIPAFGHHLISLLPSPGAAGALGGKAHLAAVKDACKSAERIHGALTMAGRFEVAIVPDTPDFFDPAPRMVKARNLAWEMFRNTPRLQWVIPTRYPEFISASLPPTWIGKGFQNVCLGLVDDGADGFPEKLQALRNAPVQRRMIHLCPSSSPTDLTGQLGEIDWVVFAGKSDDSSQVAVIEAACREANVAFLFHQPGGHMESGTTNVGPDDGPPWPVHPFGTKIQLFQPTLPDLKHVITSTLLPFSPPDLVENTLEASSSAKMKITDSPVNLSPEAPTPTIEPQTETVTFEVVTPEHITSEADPALPVISDDGSEEFYRLDHIVRRGLGTFKEVGQALTEIRERELWRAGGYTSWSAYCLAHGLTKIHANRLIKSSGVACDLAKVKPVGSTYPVLAPRSEWQIRPLHRLPNAEQQGIAWYRAAERANGQPTAKLISDIVAELMADDSPPASKPNQKQRIAEVFGRLRTSVSSNDPLELIDGLIIELEKLLKIA